MRLVSAMLLVALTGSVALAEEGKPASPQPEAAPADARPADAKPEAHRKVPLRVVKMLPETHQVLLFDRSRGTHVLAETGQDVGGYLVEEIDDDEVTLVTQNGAEVILQAPETSWRKHDRKKADADSASAGSPAASVVAGSPASPVVAGSPAAASSPGFASPSAASAAGAPAATASPGAAGPVDPYADAPTGTTAAAPIIAGDGGVRVASATPAPGAPAVDPGIQAFADAVGASPAAAPAAPAPRAAGSDTKVDVASPGATAAPLTVSRHDVDAALADFGATAVTFDATFAADGLHFDHIAKGTILAKLGLQAGDVLTAVDNQPLHSLDDAASLYARAGTAKAAKLHVVRAGAPVTVTVAIR
jgi:hypothetical protein